MTKRKPIIIGFHVVIAFILAFSIFVLLVLFEGKPIKVLTEITTTVALLLFFAGIYIKGNLFWPPLFGTISESVLALLQLKLDRIWRMQ